jgi:hypothetical protein
MLELGVDQECGVKEQGVGDAVCAHARDKLRRHDPPFHAVEPQFHGHESRFDHHQPQNPPHLAIRENYLSLCFYHGFKPLRDT